MQTYFTPNPLYLQNAHKNPFFLVILSLSAKAHLPKNIRKIK